VHFFGSNQGKAFLQIKTHLVTKTALGTGTGTVSFMNTIFQNMAKKIKVLLHAAKITMEPRFQVVKKKLWATCE
jgi:hypothetical protein